MHDVAAVTMPALKFEIYVVAVFSLQSADADAFAQPHFCIKP